MARRNRSRLQLGALSSSTRIVLGLVATACCLNGCGDEALTEVVLVINSDMCAPDQLDAVVIEVQERSGEVITQQVALTGDDDTKFPLTLTLVSKKDEGNVTVRVYGMLDEARIVTRTARFAFVAGERRTLPLDIVPTCRTTTCGEDQTCGANGVCRPIAVTADELQLWDEVEFTERVARCQTGGDGGVSGETKVAGDTCSNEDACGEGLHCVYGVCANKPWLKHAIGDAHMCSIFDDGSGAVWCRGSNRYGQLGRVGEDSNQRYVRVEGIEPATEVVAGANFTCARTRDGRVACWGDGEHGQLGRGPLEGASTSATPAYVRYDYPNDPEEHGELLQYVDSLSAGTEHVCVAGENRDRELTPEEAEPYDYAAHCWGAGKDWQLGLGWWDDREDHFTPAFVPSGSVIGVAPGSLHTCSLKYEPERTRATGYPITCWGNNYFGQLNSETAEDTFVDQLTYEGTVIRDARVLLTAENHNCILRADGRVFCWGENNYGENGQSASWSTTLMEEVEGLQAIGDVSQLAIGTDHTCVRINTDAYCFGRNDVTQLLSEGPSTHMPRKIDHEGTVLGIWAGYNRSCVWLEETGPVCAPDL